MSAALPIIPACPTCTEINTEVPGPAGAAGAAGTNGTDGVNAYTTTSANFTMPAISGSVTVSVADTSWMGVNQPVYVEDAGAMKATTILSAVSVILTNLGYTGNAAPTTVINAGALISPSGVKGVDGASIVPSINDISPTTTKGDLMVDTGAATPSPTVVRIGVGTDGMRLKANSSAAEGVSWATVNLASASEVTGTLPLGNGGTGGTSAATARSSLGAAASGLATASGLTASATDKLIGRSTAGAGAVEEIACTSVGRALIDDATVIAQRATLGNIMRRSGLLAFKLSVDCNSAGSDNSVTVDDSTRYRITKVIIENASISLTTATCGVFTAAGGGGTTIAPDQAMSALTAATKFDELTLDGGCATDVFTSATLYFRIGTAQGAAATVNVWIFGESFS